MASPTGFEGTDAGTKGSVWEAISLVAGATADPKGPYEQADVARLVTAAAASIQRGDYGAALALVNDLRGALVAKLQDQPMPQVRRRRGVAS